MKIGYPCLNLSVVCRGKKTFRLRSFSKARLLEVVKNNLDCLEKVLAFNAAENILFFRVSSDLVPFASHPVCKVNWQAEFKSKFRRIGDYIRARGMRISMHPDQFILINAKDQQIIQRSVQELDYHSRVLDLMGLDAAAKIQIHVGGVYGEKEKSIKRFIRNYLKLPKKIKKRLVIENDDRNYTLEDCLSIHSKTGVPVLFDIFHHRVNGDKKTALEAVRLAGKTWEKADGILMVDYSSQLPNGRMGAHAYSIETKDFFQFLRQTRPFDFDIMLEIKNKEKSALEAIAVAGRDSRFVKTTFIS